LIFALALMCDASVPAHAQSVSRGKQIIESRCFACHSLDFNRVGPALRGVVGRTAGKADGFEYSAALTAATYTWDVESIKKWLTNPELLVPGQRMNYQVDLKEDREDVVAYLASLTSKNPK
jgi:cytochrome c